MAFTTFQASLHVQVGSPLMHSYQQVPWQSSFTACSGKVLSPAVLVFRKYLGVILDVGQMS